MTRKLEDLRNIGIVAHIDAGKTTVTERILYYAGASHKMGEVDKGTTTTDFDQEEQQRGITIYSACVTFPWKGKSINLIDTPGHVDFTAEVERSLRVLDGAVVVFSAREGVEAQSETVWRQADKYNVPRMCFINKLDREGAEFERVFDEIKTRLCGSTDTVPLAIQLPVGEGPAHQDNPFRGIVDLVEMKLLTFAEESQGADVQVAEIPDDLREQATLYRKEMLEHLSNYSDDLITLLLEESDIPVDLIHDVIREATLGYHIVPVMCGSALKYKGIQPLLDAVTRYLPSPADVPPVVGLTILAAVILLAATAHLFYPDDPFKLAGKPMSPPGVEGFLLGSDSLGRDVAAGIAHGAKTSLLIGPPRNARRCRFRCHHGWACWVLRWLDRRPSDARHRDVPDDPFLRLRHPSGGDHEAFDREHRRRDRGRLLARRRPADPRRMQGRVHVLCVHPAVNPVRRRPEGAVAIVIGAPAFRARPVPRRQRHRLVEKEQLGVAARRHDSAAAALEREHAGHPMRHPPARGAELLFVVMQHPAIAQKSPRAGCATISPKGVTRFCSGMVSALAGGHLRCNPKLAPSAGTGDQQCAGHHAHRERDEEGRPGCGIEIGPGQEGRKGQHRHAGAP